TQDALGWGTNYDFARLALDDRITIADPQFQALNSPAEVGYARQYLLPLLNGTAGTRLPGARMTTVAIDTGSSAVVSTWHDLATTAGFADRAVAYDTTACDEPGADTAKWSACRNTVSLVRG